jgi:hypothetical protein
MRGQRRQRSFTDLAEIQRWNRSRTGSCGNEPSGSRPGGRFFSNQTEACLRQSEPRPRPLPKRARSQTYRATPTSIISLQRQSRRHYSSHADLVPVRADRPHRFQKASDPVQKRIQTVFVCYLPMPADNASIHLRADRYPPSGSPYRSQAPVDARSRRGFAFVQAALVTQFTATAPLLAIRRVRVLPASEGKLNGRGLIRPLDWRCGS